jgi:hypothetical protein
MVTRGRILSFRSVPHQFSLPTGSWRFEQGRPPPDCDVRVMFRHPRPRMMSNQPPATRVPSGQNRTAIDRYAPMNHKDPVAVNSATTCTFAKTFPRIARRRGIGIIPVLEYQRRHSVSRRRQSVARCDRRPGRLGSAVLKFLSEEAISALPRTRGLACDDEFHVLYRPRKLAEAASSFRKRATLRAPARRIQCRTSPASPRACASITVLMAKRESSRFESRDGMLSRLPRGSSPGGTTALVPRRVREGDRGRGISRHFPKVEKAI